MAQERELIEHRIKINEFVSVSMKIPEELDALELKSLTTMSTKLLNMSEINVARQISSRQKETSDRRVRFNREFKIKFLKEYAEAKSPQDKIELAERYGMKIKSLQKRVFDFRKYLKNNGGKQ